MFSFLKRFFFVFAFAVLVLGLALPAKAQRGQNVSFIRDAEIEYYLHELGRPIFETAGLNPEAIRILLIQDRDLNAFVAGGMNIFIYTGLLQAAETPEQLQGVIAHETGHIAGGHLVRGSRAMENASAEAMIGMLAGLAVGLAAGSGEVAIGAIGGAQSAVTRNLLSYSRAQESSADVAAMRFLDQSRLSSEGLLGFMEKLASQDIMPVEQQSAYVRTHPLSQARVDTISNHILSRPDLKDRALPEALHKEHERIRAKLLGYLQPEAALLRYTDTDKRPEARYARAIALYRTHNLPRALVVVDSLLKDEPANPFFMELKAQMLFENGRISESVGIYKQTVAKLPDSPLIHTAYAHALLEDKAATPVDLAIENLLEANRLEKGNIEAWQLLAAAWARKGEEKKSDKYQGLVNYARAEEMLARGEDKQASAYASRAIKALDKGSPYWLRAQDIKLTAENEDTDERRK